MDRTEVDKMKVNLKEIKNLMQGFSKEDLNKFLQLGRLGLALDKWLKAGNKLVDQKGKSYDLENLIKWSEENGRL